MTITFYQAPFSSAIPVAAALAELQVPHESVTFDLQKEEHKNSEYLQLNPNGTVPTLVVDGQPLFESLAILQWLGDRYGVERSLWPKFDSPERLPALSWTTWAYATLGPLLVRYTLATSERAPVELHSTTAASHAKEGTRKCWQVLEDQLTDREYLLGNEYSLVDLVVANTVQYATVCGLAPTKFPKVTRWLATCLERPAMKPHWG